MAKGQIISCKRATCRAVRRNRARRLKLIWRDLPRTKDGFVVLPKEK